MHLDTLFAGHNIHIYPYGDPHVSVLYNIGLEAKAARAAAALFILSTTISDFM